MNLVDFMKNVDSLTAECGKERLERFIHETARTLPETMRDDFLLKLRTVSEKGDAGAEEDNDALEKQRESLRLQYDDILASLEEIASGDCYLRQEWNEEYDDWYGSDEEAYYTDPDGVAKRLACACGYVHACVDAGNYSTAASVGRELFALQIAAYGEYGDEELALREVAGQGLLDADVKSIALDTLYSCYRMSGEETLQEETLPEVLYEVFCNSEIKDLTLEDLLQHADRELEHFDSFLGQWIRYLGGMSGKQAERLYAEAVSLLPDLDAKLQLARRYVAFHPGIYETLLDGASAADAEKMAEIGMDAVRQIDPCCLVRAWTALKTADYIQLSSKDSAALEMCYAAAFESDTNAVNYLRCLLNCGDPAACRERMRAVIRKYMGKAASFREENSYMGERAVNAPDKKTVYILRLLDGELADVLREGVSEKAALGWTGTFMKEGLAFFLLYLYEGERMRAGMAAMLEDTRAAFGFSAEEYGRGLAEKPDEDDAAAFYGCFLRWKNTVVTDEKEKKRILAHLEKTIQKRVAAIMEANRRNYYGECAAFIAAIGEVKESWGDPMAKQRVMEEYKEKYPRRSSFRAELERYGWRKNRK